MGSATKLHSRGRYGVVHHNDPAHQLSDHVQDRRKTDKLEALLEDWGAYRRSPETPLGSFTQSSLKSIEEMRPERLVNRPPVDGDLYTYTENRKTKPHKANIRARIYDMRTMWCKNVKSTRAINNRPISYSLGGLTERINVINSAVQYLKTQNTKYYKAIIDRFEHQMNWGEVSRETGLKRRTYYLYLENGKKIIKEYLIKGNACKICTS